MTDIEELAVGSETVFLIDGNNFLFRAFHALPMLTAPDGTPINAVHGFVRMVHALRRDCAPGFFAAIFDAKGPNFRHELYPEYKANRGEPPEELRPQFGLAREALDALGIPWVERAGAEADDIIATYVARAREAGQPVVVVSSDKDLMQLVTDGVEGAPSVQLLDTMKSRVVDEAAVADRFGVPPVLLGDLLALAGDSSDNIPGVPGIGPKTAAALLVDHGSLEGILAAAPEIKQKKRRERLIEHADDARMSRKLVTLAADLVVPDLDTLKDPGLDPARAVPFFERLGFAAILREMGAEVAASRARKLVPDARASEDAIELTRSSEEFQGQRGNYRVFKADDRTDLVAYVEDLRACERVAIDVTTTSPEPMRASIVGFGLAGHRDQGESPVVAYVPCGHDDLGLVGGRQMSQEDTLSTLGPLLSGEVSKCADGHKAQLLVLARHGVVVDHLEFDPMLASYVLDPARVRHSLPPLAADLLGHVMLTEEKVLGKGKKAKPLAGVAIEVAADYAGERAECCLAVTRHLAAEVERAGDAIGRLFHEVEMPLAAVLQQLERRGIALNVDGLAQQSGALGQIIGKIRAEVVQEAGYEVNIDSPIQLRKLLFEERGLPPVRKTKTGYSTDARVLEELSVLDPIVGRILEYRSLTKLKSTYLDTLPALVNPETGRLHTVFHQAVAQTGRLSSSDPNLQNIPVRTEHGRRIREAFVAPEGRTLVSLDYSQIELRVLAHLSGDPNLSSAFRDGVDVHRRTAAEVFEVPEGEVTLEQRRIAKAVNFGVIYGQTAFGLAQQLGIPRGKAGIYIKRYFEKVPGVDRYMVQLIAQAKRSGFSETILGRKRRIPELRRKGPARAHGERMARNTPIQGSAADIMKLAMIEVEGRVGPESWADMLLTVHDELIFECDEGRVDDLIALVRPAMEQAVELDVPLRVEAGHGKTWAACKG